MAEVAKEMAQIPFHGAVDGLESNLAPIVRAFPTWSLREADGLWCAAFVYYCCREAGFEIPYRPGECKTCHLAACLGWEEFALSDPRIVYHKGADGFANPVYLAFGIFRGKLLESNIGIDVPQVIERFRGVNELIGHMPNSFWSMASTSSAE